MRRSINETEAATRKAAVGAGLPFGTAAELGKACAWLAGFNVDVLTEFLHALDAAATPDHLTAPEAQEGVIAFGHVNVAQHGCNLLDYFLSAPPTAAAQVAGVDSPNLLIGLAGHRAGVGGAAIALAFSNGFTAQVAKGTLRTNGKRPTAGVGVRLTRANRGDFDAASVASSETCTISAPNWTGVQRLAARTYVPESEESRRKGAGAGENS